MTTPEGMPRVALRSTVHENLYFKIFLHSIFDFEFLYLWTYGTSTSGILGALEPWSLEALERSLYCLRSHCSSGPWNCGFCATLGAQWGWEFQGPRFGLLKSITQRSKLRLDSVSWALSWHSTYYSAFCLPTWLCLSLNISVHGGMFFIMGLGF